MEHQHMEQLPPWIHAVLIRGGSGPGAEGGPGTEIGTGIRGSPDVWRAAGRHCRKQAIGRHLTDGKETCG